MYAKFLSTFTSILSVNTIINMKDKTKTQLRINIIKHNIYIKELHKLFIYFHTYLP